MRAEKPTIHHWDCDLAELLPVGVEEQPFPSFFTTQHTRCCRALGSDSSMTPKSWLKEKSQLCVIHAG
ncbi:hypothetical protein [Prolixibacter denitrificans]|uniref:hypothetical protein n=1 Tax=Prolixibacter denitrificans TaxID=1541063 RepID=UPI0011B2335D|nr:hypothetical protein [Prolixibacter denitrificans]